MIHTLAAKARNFPVQSVGSLLDEPFTGVVYLKSSGITPDFRTLKGKKIGYVGEFGKIQIDELTSHYGMARSAGPSEVRRPDAPDRRACRARMLLLLFHSL